tara:strand:- start:1989 stop:2258 length:270 start_codon:yes stop_codon:yes gene_type:complete
MADLLTLNLLEEDIEIILELLNDDPRLVAQQLATDIWEQIGEVVQDEDDFFDAGVQAREAVKSSEFFDMTDPREAAKVESPRANDPIDW